MCPEMFDSKYTFKCDIWSAGVLLFIMLSGYAPFGNDDDDKVVERIKNCNYGFDDPFWTTVSDDVRNLISCMIKKDQQTRLTADKVLEHKWFEHVEEEESLESMRNSFDNMLKYHNQYKLQQAVWL